MSGILTFGTGFWRVALNPALPLTSIPVVTVAGASPDGTTGYTGPATATIRIFFGSGVDVQLWNPSTAVDTGFTLAVFCLFCP